MAPPFATTLLSRPAVSPAYLPHAHTRTTRSIVRNLPHDLRLRMYVCLIDYTTASPYSRVWAMGPNRWGPPNRWLTAWLVTKCARAWAWVGAGPQPRRTCLAIPPHVRSGGLQRASLGGARGIAPRPGPALRARRSTRASLVRLRRNPPLACGLDLAIIVATQQDGDPLCFGTRIHFPGP